MRGIIYLFMFVAAFMVVTPQAKSRAAKTDNVEIQCNFNQVEEFATNDLKIAYEASYVYSHAYRQSQELTPDKEGYKLCIGHYAEISKKCTTGIFGLSEPGLKQVTEINKTYLEPYAEIKEKWRATGFEMYGLNINQGAIIHYILYAKRDGRKTPSSNLYQLE